jgi:hypothetical protein
MNTQRNVISFLLALLLVGQNCQITFAAKKALGLKLKSQVINASIFDKSKNDLVIENAKGLNKTVIIKALNAEMNPVKIQGTLQDGELHCDLSQLGKSSELPQGQYLVLARRGKKKLTAQFELKPPTVYLSKVRIPLNSKTKESILRKHHLGEGSGICYSDPCPPVNPDEPQCLAPVWEVACDDPACNVGPCFNKEQEDTTITCSCHTYDPENLEQIGEELTYVGKVEDDFFVADIELETTADYPKPDCGIQVDILVDGQKESEASCIAFKEELQEEPIDINNATTAATDVYLAGITEAESLTTEDVKVENVDLSSLYDKAVEGCKSLIGKIPTTDEVKDTLAKAAQEIAEEFKMAFLSTNGNMEEMMKLGAEVAAKFAAKCPNIVDLSMADLIKPEMFDSLQYHEIASGLIDPKELGLQEGSEFIFDLYKQEGIVAGSLQLPTDGVPIYQVDPVKLAENFAQIKELAASFGEPISTKDIVIPYGCAFDPQQAIEAFKAHEINDATFSLASTAIVLGGYDPSAFTGSFTINVAPGVEGIQPTLPPSFAEYISSIGLTTASDWFSGPHEGVSEAPVPTGWTPTSDPAPTGWTPTSGTTTGHPDASGHVGPMPTTTTQPVVTTQPQPTYVPPADYHPPTSH